MTKKQSSNPLKDLVVGSPVLLVTHPFENEGGLPDGPTEKSVVDQTRELDNGKREVRLPNGHWYDCDSGAAVQPEGPITTIKALAEPTPRTKSTRRKKLSDLSIGDRVKVIATNPQPTQLPHQRGPSSFHGLLGPHQVKSIQRYTSAKKDSAIQLSNNRWYSGSTGLQSGGFSGTTAIETVRIAGDLHAELLEEEEPQGIPVPRIEDLSIIQDWEADNFTYSIGPKGIGLNKNGEPWATPQELGFNLQEERAITCAEIERLRAENSRLTRRTTHVDDRREADALEAELELASTTLHKAMGAGTGITEAMNRYEAADKAIIAAREQGNTCL